jgi:ubiquinone/menaquinone biosynthesis C-methylase UbiE
MSTTLDQIREQQHQTWDTFSAGWKRWDALVLSWLGPFGEAMIRNAKLKDRDDVLDVASGTGEPGLSAAASLPHGTVTVTDLSECMLQVAEENARRRGLHNFAVQACDACALPFDRGRFDAVFCRFGFMFFPDVAIAAREMVRVTRPGGRISCAVWSGPDKNPWATTIMAAIARHVEMPAPPAGSPGLFRCAPHGMMSSVLSEAGFHDLVEDEVSTMMTHATPEQYWGFMTEVAAPVVAGLAMADATTVERIRQEVISLAVQSQSNGKVQLRSTATIISGVR